MKRTASKKALHLTRETVRQLQHTELRDAVGGAPAIAQDTKDPTCPWTHVTAASVECGGG